MEDYKLLNECFVTVFFFFCEIACDGGDQERTEQQRAAQQRAARQQPGPWQGLQHPAQHVRMLVCVPFT